MSQPASQLRPMISACYNELMVDSSFLQSFSENQWISIHELDYLGTLHFCVVSERLFAQLTFPALWGKGGVNFITNANRKAMSAKIAPLAILVMDGVGEGSLEIVTTFCCTDQVKVEPLDMLLTLVQWDIPKPGKVVVKIFTNLPYLLWGSFGSPYLDKTTSWGGASTTQFLLAHLHLCRLLPYSSSQVILAWENEGDGLKVYPFLLQESSEEDHHLSHTVPLSVSIISPHSNIDESSQAHRLRKHLASVLPCGSYKQLSGPSLSLSGSWPSNWQG